MTHIDNLEFILQNGLWSMMSDVQDLNIVTGYGVRKFPQKEIVFLVCDAVRL